MVWKKWRDTLKTALKKSEKKLVNCSPKLLREMVSIQSCHTFGRFRKFNRARGNHLLGLQPFPPEVMIFKGAVSRYSVIFALFLREQKNGYCSRKCRGYQLGRPLEQLHRPSWVEQLSVSAAGPGGRHYFFPTQNGCQKSPIIVTLPL